MSEDFVNVEVNGVPIKARKGEMIIRVTDAHDVYVPRFCYHEKLRIAANCRMCLVEVEKAPKPLPACATPVAEGMKIFTKSPKAIGAQKAVMEFLLINHPLDCPICDQGGECELQDLAIGFGRDDSRFEERKRVVKDKSLGALVSTDMTRCIHCTRCIRFGTDIAGIQELGTTDRGENMQVGTFIEKSVDHELSGNIIDLCPVGALNSKPFRFRGRGWEMTQHPLISPHDGMGSHLFGHVLRGRLMRVVPRPSEDINETWISDRDRFSYEGVYSDDRVTTPMLRQSDGSWRNASWEEALEFTAQALKKSPAAQTGFLAHPSATVEEHYLLARIASALGSANIDHRLRQSDLRDQASDPLAPSLGMSLASVDELDALLVVGSNLRAELPMLAHRVRKAAQRGGAVSFINPAQFDYLFPVAQYLVSAPAQQVADLAAVLAAALDGAAPPAGLAAAVRAAQVTDAHKAVAASLKRGENRAVWLGALALRHPAYADLRALARALAVATGAGFGELAEGANAAGAAIAGVLPHRGIAGKVRASSGLGALAMLQQPLNTYVLLGTEPWADALAAGSALDRAACVVAITPYASEEMKRVASVLLPAAAFGETSGTFVNLEGRWQSFAGAARPLGESRPAWKILRVLGNLLDLKGCDYQSSEEVRDELHAAAQAATPIGTQSTHAVDGASSGARVVDVPMYGIDPLLRRAPSLQRTRAAQAAASVYGS